MLFEYHVPAWVAWRDAYRWASSARGDWSADSPSLEDLEQFDGTDQTRDPLDLHDRKEGKL